MILAMILGTALGAVAGLFPGIGIFLMLVSAIPLLVHWQPMEILLFYAALIQTSQFLGSLTTIVTGVAGEPSSVPTVVEIKKVNVSSYNQLIANTALGSFISAILSIGVCVWVASHLLSVSFFYRTELIAALLFVSIAMIVKYGENRILINIALMTLGIGLGLVGYNNTLGTSILTFGSVDLLQGFPIEVVAFALFVVPQLYQMRNINLSDVKLSSTIAKPVVNLASTLFFSVIGFVGGLVPGLTTTFSSMLGHKISSMLTKDPEKRIVAAETANNAGAVSQLIPMLVFGMPIVASESLVLVLMESKGYLANVDMAAGAFMSIAGMLVLTAFVGLILAWILANRVLQVLRVNLTVFRVIAVLLMILAILYQSYIDYNLLFTVQCMIFLTVVGIFLRNTDTSGLLFGFLISNYLVDHVFRLNSLYF
jgi:putative tricarboxylic transport membrane protein